MTSKTINLSRPLVAVILCELLTIVGVSAWNAFDPAANVDFLLVVCPLVCLEGLYSTWLIHAQKLLPVDRVLFHAIELIGWGVVVKVMAALVTGDFAANLLVFDARTAIGAVVAFIVWYSMLDTAQDFKELDDPPAPDLSNPNNYVSPVDRLTRRFFAGGVLIFVVGAVSVHFGQITSLAVALLAYFVVGLVFLPGLRFQLERHRWQSLGIQSNEAMIIPWVRAGLVLVAVGGVIALLLPTGFASGLLDSFRTIATFIAIVLQYVIALLFWLISLPLRALFGGANNAPGPFVPPQTPPVIPPPGSPGANPLLDLLPKLLLVGLVLYIVVSYFRDHPEFWAMLKKLRIIRFLHGAWHSVRRGAGALTKDLRVRLPALALPFRRRASDADTAFRFIRLNSLSARERILYFYLSTVRRAEAHGLPRSPIQTPHEYGETLKPALPENQTELDSLTDAFIEARYSHHPIAPDQAKQVQSNWQRVQQAIRALRKIE